MKNISAISYLELAKKNNIKLIAADFDGTIYDRYDKKYSSYLEIVKLAYKVTKHRISFAFVSGRNTTLELPLRKEFLRFCKKNKCKITIWRSGGNGMNLYKITYSESGYKVKKIYSKSITISEIEKALKIYDSLNINPDKKSQEFFLSFINKKTPPDLVPKNLEEINKRYKGKLFAESVKVTFVLPKKKIEQKKYINLFKDKLAYSDLNVSWGGIPFADVSKKNKYKNKFIDGKKFMILNLIKELKLKNTQVVTFGDSPEENNKGLLSFPFSFTNEKTESKKNINKAPYLLNVKKSKAEAVYKAIDFLLS